jgi:hypothetical protein
MGGDKCKTLNPKVTAGCGEVWAQLVGFKGGGRGVNCRQLEVLGFNQCLGGARAWYRD